MISNLKYNKALQSII